MPLRFQRLVLLLLICGLLLTVPVMLAQDETGDTAGADTTETTDAPNQNPGLATLALIIGIIFIVSTGSFMTMREGFKQPDVPSK